MVYITLKDNKIIRVCESDSKTKVIESMEYVGISEYDDIQHIPYDYFEGRPGQDIREFDSDYKLLPLSERKDYISIPEGMKIEGNEIIFMTLKDKIDNEVITLSDKEKYDNEINNIRPKTIDELFEDNLITKEEWYEAALDKCHNMRKSAYYNESDGLFFDYQRGEIDKQIWEDKIREIKLRYPKPQLV